MIGNRMQEDAMATPINAPGQSPSRQIGADLLERLHLALTALIQYIEAVPPGQDLLWFVDNKTPVTAKPGFRYAIAAAAELKTLIDDTDHRFHAAGHLQMATGIPGNRLEYSVRKTINGIVTLTLFEGRRSAAIDMNPAALRQLITILERQTP